MFERYFEVAVVTPVTEVTDPEADIGTPSDETGDLPETLDAGRVEELAEWWRTQIKRLRKELSPALAEDQARKDLREVLAEQIRESALDAEVNRIVKAAKRRSRR